MGFTIIETHESESHKRTSHNARTKWRKDNPAKTRYDNMPTKFVCIDGEGVTRPDGTHLYVLLGVGDTQITNPDGLSFAEIADFLWEQFQEHGTKGVAYVGFFLNYDFVQWLKGLREERARMLLTAEGRITRANSTKHAAPHPVWYDGWEFDILGTKRFKLRKSGTSRWMNICDTGPFFQKSFLKVIDPKEWSEPIVTGEEYATVSKGKAKRATAYLDTAMLRYNALENEILARVLCKLNEGFQSLGINLKPNQWFGPGQAAQAWLTDRAITSERLQEITPSSVMEAARMSYFGGWFELTAHGIITGLTHEYDINSAYPYIISTLPCLEHGTWTHARYAQTGDASYLRLVYAVIAGNDPHIGAMLHRDPKGNIYRPHQTEGWYWLHELQAAKNAGLIIECRISESYTYYPCDCPAPLREVRNIYNLRREVGKKTPLGIACKLVPNSLYGKFAQSVGSPKYANPVYASLITAGCRTMILNAIASHPGGSSACVMVATDGVYFTSPHPSLEISGNLGDWDTDQKENLLLFKPGVYWDDKARADIQRGDSPVFKARGVNARDFGKVIHEIDLMFKYLPEVTVYEQKWPNIKFPLEFAMITAVQALQRNNWALAGTLVPEPAAFQSSNPESKRCDPYFDGNGVIRTRPRKNQPYEPSNAYQKRFGMGDPFDEIHDMISPEGPASNAIWEALGRR